MFGNANGRPTVSIGTPIVAEIYGCREAAVDGPEGLAVAAAAAILFHRLTGSGELDLQARFSAGSGSPTRLVLHPAMKVRDAIEQIGKTIYGGTSGARFSWRDVVASALTQALRFGLPGRPADCDDAGVVNVVDSDAGRNLICDSLASYEV